MNRYKYIFFDLDGTVSNSKEGILNSTKYALSKFNIEEEDESKLEKFIGPPLIDSFMNLYSMSEEDAKLAVKYYRELYLEKGIYQCYAYEGIEELIDKLIYSDYKVALATSKPQKMAEEVLTHLGLIDRFCMVVGADINNPHENKEAVLKRLMANLDIKDKSQCILIGDTDFDAIGAKNAGIDMLGVSFGFGNKESMLDNNAIKVVDSPMAVFEFLGRMKK